MPHSFWRTGILWKLRGADPLICAGRPRPALLSKDQQLVRDIEAGLGASRGPGVRPTIYAAGPKGANLCGIGPKAVPQGRRRRAVLRVRDTRIGGEQIIKN